MGANGSLRCLAYLRCTNNANAKTWFLRLGGILLASGSLASMDGLVIDLLIANANSETAQKIFPAFGGSVAGAMLTAAVDTTIAQSLTLSVQKATAGDTISAEGLLLESIYNP